MHFKIFYLVALVECLCSVYSYLVSFVGCLMQCQFFYFVALVECLCCVYLYLVSFVGCLMQCRMLLGLLSRMLMQCLYFLGLLCRMPYAVSIFLLGRLSRMLMQCLYFLDLLCRMPYAVSIFPWSPLQDALCSVNSFTWSPYQNAYAVSNFTWSPLQDALCSVDIYLVSFVGCLMQCLFLLGLLCRMPYALCSGSVTRGVGQNHLCMYMCVFIGCLHGVLGREITKYTVICGGYLRIWPTRNTQEHSVKSLEPYPLIPRALPFNTQGPAL